MSKNDMYKKSQSAVRISRICVCGNKAHYERIFLGSKEEPNLHLCKVCYHNSFIGEKTPGINDIEDLKDFLIRNKNEVLK